MLPVSCHLLFLGLAISLGGCAVGNENVPGQPDALIRIALHGNAEDSRRAIRQLDDQPGLEQIATQSAAEAPATQAIRKINDQAALMRVAATAKNPEARRLATAQISQPALLRRLAIEHHQPSALAHIDDPEMLLDIAMQSSDATVQEQALSRISTADLERLRHLGGAAQKEQVQRLWMQRLRVDLAGATRSEFATALVQLRGSEEAKQIATFYLFANEKAVMDKLRQKQDSFSNQDIELLQRAELLAGRSLDLAGRDRNLQAVCHFSRSRVRVALSIAHSAMLKAIPKLPPASIQRHRTRRLQAKNGALRDAERACLLQPKNQDFARWKQRMSAAPDGN